MMSGIRGKNTRPELIVRKALHARGFRYRLHEKRLPGKPDITFPRHKAVIQVHGCFWHWHHCHLFKWPKTRYEFWSQKIRRNRSRDTETLVDLQNLGWRVLTIWECSLKGRTRIPFNEVVDQTVEWLNKGTVNIEIEGSFNGPR